MMDRAYGIKYDSFQRIGFVAGTSDSTLRWERSPSV